MRSRSEKGGGSFAAFTGGVLLMLAVKQMLEYARSRGIRVARAVAEALPFADAAFDYALSVTTLCFVDAAAAMLAEARRILRPGGELVIGFIDRESSLGRHYLAHQAQNVFYRDARFHSADEVARLLREAGFGEPVWAQTLSTPLEEIREVEALCAGRGRGAFVVVSAPA
jgi:SAM-dependent methyltransferase